jgi:acid phosphatase type 7
MQKPLFMQVARLLGMLALGWSLLSSSNSWAVQAGTSTAAPQAVTAGSIFIPLVSGGTSGSSTSASDPVILAAGDIARCGAAGTPKTAALIKKYPSAIVLPLGDNAYETGTLAEYQTCYNPTWGAFLNRTKPVPGNHDFLTPGGSGYYQYFGAAAGTPGKGYYSYNLGSWHLIALNSSCGDAGGCGSGSAQERWLKADLTANKNRCVLAYWHQPYYTTPATGGTGPSPAMGAIWTDLFNAGAEVVLSGHIHAYERFAPQNASGGMDAARGVVQFVVGTGGSNFTPLLTPFAPNTLAEQDTSFGVLKLTLHAASYTYQFLPVSGKYTDTGTVNCH